MPYQYFNFRLQALQEFATAAADIVDGAIL
jgi:hypothetical protein